ncbi:MAG: prolyl oligopeptidase family serine peptidase [Anaerolineae bacterium]|nr:prolyl oligopeptidase family serine peptidase [Anaerolineae bacterium]
MNQTPQVFQQSITKTVRLNYLLSLPEGYAADGAAWPLILFLHGIRQRGDDVGVLTRNGIPALIEKQGPLPFIVVSPQCPVNTLWSDHVDALVMLLDDIATQYRVDVDRIYLTGLSMGGYGAWFLGTAHPERFAAAAPICGGGIWQHGFPERVCVLKGVPVWAFHGAKDTTVPVAESQTLVNTLRACGGDARLTIYPDAGHDSWTETYDNPDLYTWFLSHVRRPISR